MRPRVLNTRPREQSAELSQLLVAADFEPIEAPAIATVVAWDASELNRVRHDLHARAFEWVVLPSQNAARGLEHELPNAHVVCGAATARALGLAADVELERFSARAALEALRARITSGTRVLVPRAAEGRVELIEGLRALGGEVSAPVAYGTIAVPEAAACLRAGGIDVLTLCSPSAARSVAAAIPADTLVVCLGETTAAAAREMGLRLDAIAASTSMAALVDCVRTVLRQVRV